MSEAFIVRRGGGANSKIIIVVEAPTGSTVTCSDGVKTFVGEEVNGKWLFNKCKAGTWTIRGELGENSNEQTVVIPDDNSVRIYTVSIVYFYSPDLSYTGNYKIVDDAGNAIENFATYKGNWEIYFLTSGDLKIENLNKFDGRIEMFLVAGGGGGNGGRTSSTGDKKVGYPGGGGYWLTSATTLNVGTYPIVIGAGGNSINWGSDNRADTGGRTTAFNESVNGGTGGTGDQGAGAGTGGSAIGKFGKTGTAYSGFKSDGTAGDANTGKGGGTTQYGGGNGGSGIVIIRNAR